MALQHNESENQYENHGENSGSAEAKAGVNNVAWRGVALGGESQRRGAGVKYQWHINENIENERNENHRSEIVMAK
jgi:hypothetical protein